MISTTIGMRFMVKARGFVIFDQSPFFDCFQIQEALPFHLQIAANKSKIVRKARNIQ